MNRGFVSTKSQKEEKRQRKIIKRYGNRKLYDTQQSSYVVLNDIAKMVRNNEEVRVIDNETKDDITNATLTQIIFSAEKKSNSSTPLEILKKIIQTKDGSLSSFLAEEGFSSPAGEKVIEPENFAKTSSPLDPSVVSAQKQRRDSGESLEERIVNSAGAVRPAIEENDMPELPNTNKNLDAN